MTANGGGRAIRARLDAARERGFVGREGALDLFRQALEADEPPFAALFVHGPGGVGKTTLLRRLVREARAAGAHTLELDAHAIPATHDEVLRALGAPSLDALTDELAAHERVVLALDTYEQLAPLDAWVRERLAPALPESALLVLAGREPPSPAWRTDPGWASLMATVALGNLSMDESARLLAARGVPPESHRAIHELTYGHPLALALVADLRRQGELSLPALSPDVVRALLEALLRTVPSARHREALELAALARHVDGALLAELAGDAGGELFEWLRSLSFVDATHEGLYLHDIVRDALLIDARARDAEASARRKAALGERAVAKILGASGPARVRGAHDLLHLYRVDPRMRPFYGWLERLGGASRPMRPHELGALLALAREHEGEAAERIASELHDRHPEAFVALESAAGELRGFLVYLRLDAATLAAERARGDDPVIEAVAASLERLGPLRPGEHASLLRFWLWVDGYQELGSPTHVPHSTFMMIEWCTSPGLGPAFVLAQRAEAWEPFLRGIDFPPLRDHAPEHARARVGDRDFHLFFHDFRLCPPEVWMAGDLRSAPASLPRRVLSPAEFDAAVREALRACGTRRAELATSPLLGTRLLAEWAEGEAPTPEMIVELLEVATSSLDGERDERARRTVELTYLRAAPTQEVAAERLGLSFSTYRRQLARGVDAVVAYLWEREVSSPSSKWH